MDKYGLPIDNIILMYYDKKSLIIYIGQLWCLDKYD